MAYLTQHGFVINRNKRSLIPSQSLIHLGLLVDTRSFQHFLSLERREKIQNLLLFVWEAQRTTLTTLASLMGLMVMCQDVIPWSRSHLRPLQAFLRPYMTLIEKKANLSVARPSNLRVSLDWWPEPHRLYVGTSLDQPVKLVLTTDASLSGWGA